MFMEEGVFTPPGSRQMPVTGGARVVRRFIRQAAYLGAFCPFWLRSPGNGGQPRSRGFEAKAGGGEPRRASDAPLPISAAPAHVTGPGPLSRLLARTLTGGLEFDACEHSPAG